MQRFVRTIFSQRFLFYTNSLGSGLLMCLGDTIQQSVELYTRPEKRGYDLKRIAHMGTIGLFMGPPQHFFYKYLDKYLPRRSLKSIAYKICLDQAIISPTCIVIFLGGLGLLEAKPHDGIVREIREKFFIIYTTDWLLWPPCQYVNFTYVKAKYRVMYVNAITVIYDILLSYIKYTDDMFGTRASEKGEVEQSRDREVVSSDRGMLSSDREMLSSDREVVSSDRGMLSSDGGMLSRDRQVVSSDRGILSSDRGMLSRDREVVSSDRGMLSSDNLRNEGSR